MLDGGSVGSRLSTFRRHSETQAAEMLTVHPKTVRNYIVAGKLTLNGCGQIPIEAVDKVRSSA